MRTRTTLAMTGLIAAATIVTLTSCGGGDGEPAKAGGIDRALLTLRNQPFGEFLLILAALGLIIFGVYGLCEARWRNVKPSWTVRLTGGPPLERVAPGPVAAG